MSGKDTRKCFSNASKGSALMIRRVIGINSNPFVSARLEGLPSIANYAHGYPAKRKRGCHQ